MAVAVDTCHGFKPFAARPPRCKLQSFTNLDYKMLDFSTQQSSKLPQSLEHAFEFTNFHKSFSTPCLSHTSTLQDDTSDSTTSTKSRVEIMVGHSSPRVRALVVEVAIAMASGINPEPVSSGLGGAYFLRSQNGDTIAVAKPVDEEPLAFNNPKGFAGRMLGQPGMKCSIRIGETGIRESAAYLLDHDGFSGVPPTALVKFSHVPFNLNGSTISDSPYKIASLQRFVSHDSDAGDLGSSSFSVTSVHHIGILDVRLMNLDRHAGNILVKQVHDTYAGGGKAELVPIDHGFCLPESLEDPYFEWLHWPQASLPFSEAEVDYIFSLDPFQDAEILRTELPSIRESSIRVLVLCTIFLKQATAYGLCLADIGEMMTRDFQGGEENGSILENLCIIAKANLNIGLSDASTNNDDHDDEKEEDEMFKLDDEDDEKSPSKGKPPKMARFSSMSVLDDDSSGMFSLNKEDKYHQMVDACDMDTILDNCANTEESGEDNNPKACGLMRSLSFPVPNYNHDGQFVSFGEMDDEEWRLFLECFENLLPSAFEERKSMGLSKQRLGSSCEF